MTPGIGTATHDFTALRWEGFKATIEFRGLDFTGAQFAMDFRAYRDAPGDALIALRNAPVGDQGLSVEVVTVDGVVSSFVTAYIYPKVLWTTLPFPESGVPVGPNGPVVKLAYDLHITKEPELPEHRWLEGSVVIQPGATQHRPPANTVTSGDTLAVFRNAIAELRAGFGKVTVPIVGDSYAEQDKVLKALKAYCAAAGLPVGTGGWVNMRGVTQQDGVVFTQTGFTLWDASDGTAPSYRAGIDGHYRVRSGTGGSFLAKGMVANQIKLFYDRGQTGSFRYRTITEGVASAWQTVTPSGSPGVTSVNITGLPLKAHTLEVDTAVSTGGFFVPLGIYYTTDAPCIEFLKAGNSSLQASDLIKFQDYAGDLFSLLLPKLIIMILGTNDYQRSDSPPPTFSTELGSYFSQIRALNPNVGFAFVTPPDTDGTPVNPLTAYDTAMDARAVSSGIEKISWLRFSDIWKVENALGNFDDLEHPSLKGAKAFAAFAMPFLLGEGVS